MENYIHYYSGIPKGDRAKARVRVARVLLAVLKVKVCKRDNNITGYKVKGVGTNDYWSVCAVG